MTAMKYCAVFPGQGSQYPGMSKALREHFPYTKAIYEEASEAIRDDLSKLCLEGPTETLQLTANAQPAILTTSYAWLEVLRKELGFSPVAAAGHSLGEYTALLAAGAVTLMDVVRLVRRRGELMQTAVPEGRGKMAAVLGLSDEQVILLCKKASEGEHSIVVPANFNAPAQIVIAGHAAAVDRAEKIATTDPELKARKVIPLKVSAPFHSPLMQPAGEQFAAYLNATEWKGLNMPIAFNVDGRLRTEADIPKLLREQMDHSVLWTACTKSLATLQPAFYVEPGPSKVLTGLIKRIVDGAKTLAVDSIEDIKLVEKELNS